MGGKRIRAWPGGDGGAQGEVEDSEPSYEAERKAILEENRKRMLEVGLLDASNLFPAPAPKTPRKLTPKPTAEGPPRRSSRMRAATESYKAHISPVHRRVISRGPASSLCKEYMGRFRRRSSSGIVTAPSEDYMLQQTEPHTQLQNCSPMAPELYGALQYVDPEHRQIVPGYLVQAHAVSSGRSQQNSPALGSLEPMILQQSDGMGRGEEDHCQPANSNAIVAPGDFWQLSSFPLEPSFCPLGEMIIRRGDWMGGGEENHHRPANSAGLLAPEVYMLPHTEPHTQLSMPPEGCDPGHKRFVIDTKAMIPSHELVTLPSEIPGQEPFMVNTKRYHRILQRRHERAQLLAKSGGKTGRSKKPYLHESRHKQAIQRERGAKGRFLTKRKGEAATKDEGCPSKREE